MEKNEFFGTKNTAISSAISTKTIFFEFFLIFFKKGIAFCFFMCYNNYAKRPVGQAVKTLASHAGNMGSIPVRVTKKETSELCSDVSFYSSRRLGMESRVSVYGIAIGAWHHRRCIFYGLIPYATASQFHSATSCGFHTRLRRDLDVKGE